MTAVGYPPEFQVYHVLSTGGAAALGIAYILPLAYLAWSLFYGGRAGSNPWNACGLEWQAPSPPPHDNFLFPPRVTDPYDYHPAEGPAELPGDAA